MLPAALGGLLTWLKDRSGALIFPRREGRPGSRNRNLDIREHEDVSPQSEIRPLLRF